MDFGKDFKKYALDKGISSMNMHYYENSLTPYILEERAMNVSQLDVFSRLMRDRQIFLYGTVSDNMSSITCAQLLYLENVAKDSDITMLLSSPGGSVYSGNTIVNTMDYISPDVATINLGMCASMASVILSSGTKGKRSTLINSKVMIHQASSGSSGHVSDNRISQMETEKLNYLLFKKLARNCGKSFDEVIGIANRDKWFNSKESKDFGLVDEIIGLDKNPCITDDLEGFDEYYLNLLKQ